MDPLTQASIGAAASAIVCRKAETRHALLLGALAGAAPDLDVLIRSESDPLLALEYHRHFTHALLIAPLIGLLVAVLFKGLFFWKHYPYRRLILFGTVGAITHGLIDACTSYGTLLYWPISHHRESWDIISIIDPIFTLPLVLFTVIAFVFRRPHFAQFAVALCLIYLSLGIYQRGQAKQIAAHIAEERGHEPEELSVRPSFANILLWRTVYRAGNQYYVDAVRTTPLSEPKQYPGSIVDAFSEASAQIIAPKESVLADDIERFRFFSQGYLYRYSGEANVVADLRYALFPDSIKPLWGIRVNPANPQDHVSMEFFREPSASSLDRLLSMIRGKSVEPLD